MMETGASFLFYWLTSEKPHTGGLEVSQDYQLAMSEGVNGEVMPERRELASLAGHTATV